jgi:hypothetical protein
MDAFINRFEWNDIAVTIIVVIFIVFYPVASYECLLYAN